MLYYANVDPAKAYLTKPRKLELSEGSAREVGTENTVHLRVSKHCCQNNAQRYSYICDGSMIAPRFSTTSTTTYKRSKCDEQDQENRIADGEIVYRLSRRRESVLTYKAETWALKRRQEVRLM